MNKNLVDDIYRKVVRERLRQDEKWGQQDWPLINDFDKRISKMEEPRWKRHCDEMALSKTLDWRTILMEETSEVFAEDDPDKQVEELVQVAAVVFAMIECVERNRK